MLALAALALPLPFAADPGSGSWPMMAADGPSVSVFFPTDTSEAGSAAVAQELATALGLGLILGTSTVVYGVEDPRGVWADGLNHTIPLAGHGPPAAPQTVVEAATLLGPVIRLHYTATEPVVPSSGSFVFAEIAPYPVDVSVPGAAQAALLAVSVSLGIVADGTEQLVEYVGRTGGGDRLSSTLFRPYDGRPVEFANQFQILGWTSNGTVEALRLFPWIEPLAPPVVSEADGLRIALAHVNETVELVGYRFSGAGAGYAMDPRVYRFARSYHLAYAEEDAPQNGTTPLTSWVDAESGDVLLVDSSRIRPSGGGPGSSPIVRFVTTYGALVLVAAAAALAVSMSLRSDGARLAVLAAVTFPFFSLSREHALEHFVRGQIYEYLRSRPGSTYSDIRDDLSLNNGTAAHHLMVLEKLGLLVSKRQGRLKHFFRADTPDRVVRLSLSALQYDILDAIGGAGYTQAELAARLHVSRQRVSRNVRALERRGFVVYEGKGVDLKLTEAGVSSLKTAPFRAASAEDS